MGKVLIITIGVALSLSFAWFMTFKSDGAQLRQTLTPVAQQSEVHKTLADVYFTCRGSKGGFHAKCLVLAREYAELAGMDGFEPVIQEIDRAAQEWERSA